MVKNILIVLGIIFLLFVVLPALVSFMAPVLVLVISIALLIWIVRWMVK